MDALDSFSSASARRPARAPRRRRQGRRTPAPSPEAQPATAHRDGPATRPAAGVRWDRLGRVALLLVVAGVLGLYIGPLHSLWTTWHQARAAQAQNTALLGQNRLLRTRRAALAQPATIEREARSLGMVHPGERPYVISGLPGGP